MDASKRGPEAAGAAAPIFLLVGGPAVGKSTTSRALAARFGKSVHVPVDDLREMVVAGLNLPNPDWGEELVRQIALARGVAIGMALDYAAAGFAVVIDDFYDPRGLVEYRALLGRPTTHPVLLYPTPDEARRRHAARSGGGPGGASIDAVVSHAYSALTPVVGRLEREGWLVLDTTRMSVDATVAAILEHARLLRPGASPTAEA